MYKPKGIYHFYWFSTDNLLKWTTKGYPLDLYCRAYIFTLVQCNTIYLKK